MYAIILEKHVKRYEYRDRPAEKVKRLVETKCDICNADISNHRNGDFDEITVERKTGYAYPECGHHFIRSFDICGACFETKIEPFLSSLGADATVEEVDW